MKPIIEILKDRISFEDFVYDLFEKRGFPYITVKHSGAEYQIDFKNGLFVKERTTPLFDGEKNYVPMTLENMYLMKKKEYYSIEFVRRALVKKEINSNVYDEELQYKLFFDFCDIIKAVLEKN